MKMNDVFEAEGLRTRYVDPQPVKVEELPEMERLAEVERQLGIVPEGAPHDD